MQWINLTDILVGKALGYIFVVHRERRLGSFDWYITKDGATTHEGTCPSIGKAKAACLAVLKTLKQDGNIYVKANGKLTRKKYARTRKVGSAFS